MKHLFIAAIAAGAVLASCGSGERAEEAKTGEAMEVTEVAEAQVYSIAANTTLNWRGFKKFIESEHVGTIAVAGGEFQVAEGKVVGGKVTIDMNNIIDTDLTDEGKNAYLVGHLKSDDFFDVANHPEATFEIVEVREAAGEGTNSVVVGNLTLRGTTNSIEFPANITVADNQVTFAAPTFSIDRTKWGANFHDENDPEIAASLKDDLIAHEIELDFNLTAAL